MEVETPTEKVLTETKPVITSTPSSKGRASTKKKPSTGRKKTVKRKKEAVSGEESGQEASEYAVEKIVDKRIVEGVIQYFIKWQGWPPESNTWEPIDHLGNCHMMIQAYENKLAGSKKKKTPGKQGRCSSIASSVASSSATGNTTRSNKRGRKPTSRNKAENLSASDEELSSGVEDEDIDIRFGILPECPSGKEIEKIHAVAVVDGYLTFLVQWKTKESQNDKRPPLSDTNASMVRAVSFNEKFPQEVIKYYEKSIRFNICLDPVEQEAIKAARAKVLAEERKRAAALKQQSSLGDDDGEDAASKAIAQAERKYDRFDPLDSDLTSSSSDEEFPTQEDREQDLED